MYLAEMAMMTNTLFQFSRYWLNQITWVNERGILVLSYL